HGKTHQFFEYVYECQLTNREYFFGVHLFSVSLFAYTLNLIFFSLSSLRQRNIADRKRRILSNIFTIFYEQTTISFLAIWLSLLHIDYSWHGKQVLNHNSYSFVYGIIQG